MAAEECAHCLPSTNALLAPAILFVPIPDSFNDYLHQTLSVRKRIKQTSNG